MVADQLSVMHMLHSILKKVIVNSEETGDMEFYKRKEFKEEQKHDK